MNMYFTGGTEDYLKKIVANYPHESLLLLMNDGAYLLVHETNGTSLFKEPRKYEVIDGSGNPFISAGFAVFNHIVVMDESRPLFEYHFKNRARLIEKEPGFAAIRILRPLKSDTYIIFTLWHDEAFYKKWQSSDSFKEAHSKKNKTDEPKIFLRPSFVTKYWIYEEEE